MTGVRDDLALACVLVRADLVAGRRRLGGGRGAETASGVGSLALLALVAVASVATAAAVHGLATGGSPAAAAGAVDLLFAAALATGLVSPATGGPTARVEALGRASAAPLGARVRLLAAGLRELLAAPVGPVAALAVAGAFGVGAAAGPGSAVLAALLAASLSLFALGAGATLALWASGTRRPAAWRMGTVVAVVVAIASLSGRVPFGTPGVDAFLASIHAAQRASFLLPSWWSAAPLDAAHAGNAAAWWPLVVLPLATAWMVWSAPRLLPQSSGRRRDGRPSVAVRPPPGWPGAFGALLAKDVVLLRRDRGLHAALLRHSALAVTPLAAVVAAAWLVRGDPHATARLARALPDLALVAHLVVVAWSGPATLMAGTDGGGGVHVLSLPVRAESLVAGKALAWALVLAPALALATGTAVALAGWACGADDVLASALAAAAEGAAAGCAATGAGIVAAILWPARAGDVEHGPPPARTGWAGLVAGAGAAALTLAATLVVALLFRSAGPAGAVLGVVAGSVELLLGIALAASLLRARREAVARALARPSRRR